MRYFAILGMIIVVAVVATASSALYTVQETEFAIVLQFGRPVGQEDTPGLHVKMPFIQQVERMDRRVLVLDTRPERVLSVEQRPIIIDTYTRWRIVDPLAFYQTTRTRGQADLNLTNLMRSNLRAVVGDVTFETLLSPARGQLMQDTQELINAQSERWGIEIVDVRILRADLPDEIEQTVFNRMNAERQAVARESRARGQAEALRITARAERDAVVLLANAERQAQITRGEGDAERNRVFAEAYGRDADFFAFYRAMLAYENALQNDNTRLVLSPDSEFFRYFADPMGTGE